MCPKAIVLCPDEWCAHCRFRDDMEHCPNANKVSVRSTPPFWYVIGRIVSAFTARWIAADDDARKSIDHFNSCISTVKADLALVGLTPNSLLSDMTRAKFNELVSILENNGLSDDRICGHLAAFRQLTKDEWEPIYAEDGYALFKFSVPRHSTGKSAVQEISERDAVKFENLMGKWATDGERDLFVVAWLGIFAGMRWGDACRATWSIFKRTVDGVFVEYVPHKTRGKRNAVVSFRVESYRYLSIERFVGEPDEYCIPRHAKNGGMLVHGAYVGRHRELHERVNAAIRSCGIGCGKHEKVFHALRKYFMTRQAMRFGASVAARMGGDTLKVASDHYIGTASGVWK